MTKDNFIYGITVCSTIPRGKIISINLPKLARKYIAVSAKNIPGKNLLSLFNGSMPLLAENEVMYMGQPILLLAGFLAGINICPPFLLGLSYAMSIGDVGRSVLF